MNFFRRFTLVLAIGVQVGLPACGAQKSGPPPVPAWRNDVVPEDEVGLLCPPSTQSGTEPLKGTTRPKLIHSKMPEISKELLEARGSARMFARCTMTTEGTLVDCCIIEGINGLNAPAIAALREWRFEPATYQGKPIAITYVVPLRFEMRGRGR